MIDLSTGTRKVVFASAYVSGIVAIAAACDMLLPYPFHPFHHQIGFDLTYLFSSLIVIWMARDTWIDLSLAKRDATRTTLHAADKAGPIAIKKTSRPFARPTPQPGIREFPSRRTRSGLQIGQGPGKSRRFSENRTSI